MDHYELTAASTATAIAHDDRSVRGANDPTITAVGGAIAGLATVDGMAFGALGGAGYLTDGGGNDAYITEALTDASVDVRARPVGSITQSNAETGRAHSWSQGTGATGGLAELRDLGGTDTYRSTSRASATTPGGTLPGDVSTSSQGSVEAQQVQGAGDPAGGVATFVDRDGGAADTFVTVPADAACTGTRGQGQWVDCGKGIGIGSVS